MAPKYSIVIPCYNEEKNIPLILNRFKDVITTIKLEVVLVNNGSTDNSEKIISEILPDYPFAKSVTVVKNQGYGFGILAGLNNCIGEYIGWTHADMQTDPSDVIKAINIIENSDSKKEVYVKGSRKGRPKFDQLFTTGMSIFESIYLRRKLHDINAQPNMFHKNFYASWENPPHDFSLDLYALYMAKVKNLTIIRFPVNFPKRIYGESKWNTGLLSKWKFIKRTVQFSTKLKRELER